MVSEWVGSGDLHELVFMSIQCIQGHGAEPGPVRLQGGVGLLQKAEGPLQAQLVAPEPAQGEGPEAGCWRQAHEGNGGYKGTGAEQELHGRLLEQLRRAPEPD